MNYVQFGVNRGILSPEFDFLYKSGDFPENVREGKDELISTSEEMTGGRARKSAYKAMIGNDVLRYAALLRFHSHHQNYISYGSK